MTGSYEKLRRLRYKGDCLHDSGVPLPDESVTIQRREAKRKNLASAVRIAPELFPSIAMALEGLRERLEIAHVPEGYVFNSPETQAYSFAGDTETMTIAVSSGLVALLSPDELMFIMGHEVGHSVMEHTHYPIEEDSRTEVEALNLRALQQACEISADRIGFVASRSRNDAFRAIVKTASGLPDAHVRCDIAAYLDQARELTQMGGSATEALSTHPMFTARLRALVWFEMSAPYYDWLGRSGQPPITADELSTRVEQDLAAATGFRLVQLNEQRIERALIWGFMALFVADNQLSLSEQALLRRGVGTELANKAISFARDNGPEGVHRKFVEALQEVSSLPPKESNALLHDLELFAAHAEGDEGPLLRILDRVKQQLSIERPVKILRNPRLENLRTKALRRDCGIT